MRHTKQGFTLVELLIVLAIIGILASVLLPQLLNARTIARERATEVYGQYVYRTGLAYLSDNILATVSDVVVDCGPGKVYNPGGAGSYSVPDPAGAVVSCEVTAVNNSEFQVKVVSPTSRTFIYP